MAPYDGRYNRNRFQPFTEAPVTEQHHSDDFYKIVNQVFNTEEPTHEEDVFGSIDDAIKAVYGSNDKTEATSKVFEEVTKKVFEEATEEITELIKDFTDEVTDAVKEVITEKEDNPEHTTWKHFPHHVFVSEEHWKTHESGMSTYTILIIILAILIFLAFIGIAVYAYCKKKRGMAKIEGQTYSVKKTPFGDEQSTSKGFGKK